MNDVCAFDRIFKDRGIRFCRHHLISSQSRIEYGSQIQSRNDAEPALALLIGITTYDSDIVSLRLQMVYEIICCYARSVIGLTEHITYDRNVHCRTKHP